MPRPPIHGGELLRLVARTPQTLTLRWERSGDEVTVDLEALSLDRPTIRAKPLAGPFVDVARLMLPTGPRDEG